MEDLTVRNQYLEERLLSLESQLSREPLSRPSVSAAQFSYNCFSQHLNTLISLMPSCKRHSSSQTLSFSTPLIMKNKRLASPSHLSCSSNVVDLISFDTNEAEPPQSQMHLDQSTDVMGQSVHVEESVVGESEDPVHADKSEAQEERSEDNEKADETRGQDESGQDETLEEPKTDGEGEEESGATHEMTEKVLDEGEVDKTERSKEQLGEGESKEHVEMNEGEPSQDVKPSTQSEELKDSGRILDTTLTSREPETEVVSQPDPSEDLEACTNTDLNFAEDDLDVTDDLLEPLESEFTIPLDKKHAMKSKTEARKPHKVHDESSVGCPVKPPL